MSDCKSVDVLPGAISQNFWKFEPVPRNSNRMLAEGSVACGKDKNHQKCQLSTCDKFVNLGGQDFFVG